MPRPPLPRSFTDVLRKKLRNVTFATNPCRVRFYTQEIVIFRDNILSKIRRNCILPPTDISRVSPLAGDVASNDCPFQAIPSGRLGPRAQEVTDSCMQVGEDAELFNSPPQPIVKSTEHLVKTLLDQSHLCPLPLRVNPVYWQYDHALRLYPLPDVVVLADFYDQYHWCYEECVALNPGSFPTEFSFVVYRPATRGTEFSRV